MEVNADTSETEPEPYTSEISILQNMDITVTLSADPTTVDHAGEEIDYTLTLVNTGNVTLTNVTFTDTPDISWVLSGDTDLDGELDVDESWVYTASHSVSQAEIDSGLPIHLQVDVTNDQTAPETREVDVLIVNAIPVAVADGYDMHWSDTILNVTAETGVLANDSDANLNPLTVELVSGVTYGILDLELDGSFSYTPTPGYYGPSDSFTYRAFDGLDYSNPAVVDIHYTNTLPVGAVDEYSTLLNQVLSVNAATGLMQNDNDTDGDTLTVELVTGPAPEQGDLVLNNDGSFTFTPEYWFTGDVTFTYRLYDGLEYSDPIVVTIHVRGIQIFLPKIRRPAIYYNFLPINARPAES
jgi:uncharacterized repeat protein (TIGR01451 family)